MNLATGLKEARLNVPEPETAHSDLVIIDEPEVRREQAVLEVEPEPPRVRPPRYDADEAESFHSATSRLKGGAITGDEEGIYVPALTDLQDLAHSQDWGLALTKDRAVIHLLVQTLQELSGTLVVRSLSALLLATAIQNNPEALAAALSHFRNDEFPTKPMEAVLVALMHDQCPLLLTRAVFLLSALCQDPKQLEMFVNAGGLQVLLDVFDYEHAGQDDRDKLRGKIANFIHDYAENINELAAKAVETHVEKDEADGVGQDEDWVLVDSKWDWSKLRDDWEEALEQGLFGMSEKKVEDRAEAVFRSMNDARRAITRGKWYLVPGN